MQVINRARTQRNEQQMEEVALRCWSGAGVQEPGYAHGPEADSVEEAMSSGQAAAEQSGHDWQQDGTAPPAASAFQSFRPDSKIQVGHFAALRLPFSCAAQGAPNWRPKAGKSRRCCIAFFDSSCVHPAREEMPS